MFFLGPLIFSVAFITSSSLQKPTTTTTSEQSQLAMASKLNTLNTHNKKAKTGHNLVSLERLLSSCIDASLRGCQVIRDYKLQNENDTVAGKLKEEAEVKSVVTQADIDAQYVIVTGLRRLWGDALNIVGEEDESEEKPTVDMTKQEPLRTDLLQGIVPETVQVPMEELTLFVDPLDGTREFVEGRVQNVGCLIGVARRGKSIMGSIGLPFPGGISAPAAKAQYAIHMDDDAAKLSHYGVYPVDKDNGKKATQKEDSSFTLFTGDSKDQVLSNATKLALTIAAEHSKDSATPNHSILGGTTSKLVAVSHQERSLAVLHFKTCYWDTCAPEAVLNAIGGKVTDFFGSPLVHKDDKRYNYGNLWGVIASSKGMEEIHDQLTAGMRADVESVQRTLERCMGRIPLLDFEPQAVDICRDLDGYPLTKEWLEEHILKHQSEGHQHWTLKGFAVPDSQAHRGLMSNGARIMLDWMPTTHELDQVPPPSSVFYKRVIMSDLTHARAKLISAPHKVIRDVHSYQVETNFLDSRACQEGLIYEAGVQVCDCYGSDQYVPPDGMDPREQLEAKFSMLLEDFKQTDGWYQEWLLEEVSTKAALKAFANMHAYFWKGSNFWKKEDGKLGKELEQVVWQNGGYMQPALQGYEQLEKVATGWKNRLPSFKDDLNQIPELQNVNLDDIGARVEKIAERVGTRAHPFAEAAKRETLDLHQYRTLIHGDPKQSNIFFRKKTKDDTAEELEVGLIDLQWAGWGLAATDVAHHICAALQPHCVSFDGEKEKVLLDYYYECLSGALVKHGVASSIQDVQDNVFPRHVLQDQYEVAFLDICRMVLAYAWARWKPETAPSPSSFNRNAYNKSLPSVLWFITRCAAVLLTREEGLLEE